MHKILTALCACALAMTGNDAFAKKTLLDAGLYTGYVLGPTQVSFTVCGGLAQSDGCFGNAQLEPFEQACAVLEGAVKQKQNVLTRAIYVLDKRTATRHAPATLYVYTRTDTITDTTDTVQVTFRKKITLGLKGGASSKCFMAANDAFIYAGTDANATAVYVDKTSLAVTSFGGTFPPTALSSIVADDRGYVSAVFGTASGNNAFYIFTPTGLGLAGGGGTDQVVGTRNSLH